MPQHTKGGGRSGDSGFIFYGSKKFSSHYALIKGQVTWKDHRSAEGGLKEGPRVGGSE